jgi:hypothetical protein
MPCPGADEGAVAAAEEVAADAEGDVEQAAQTANAAPTSAAAIPALFPFARNRRVTALPPTDGPDVMPVSWESIES